MDSVAAERAASIRGGVPPARNGGVTSDPSNHAAAAAAAASGRGAASRLSSVRAPAADSLRRKGSEWEILGSLEQGVPYGIKPKKQEGYLAKRRKWPLKGWHKR